MGRKEDNRPTEWQLYLVEYVIYKFDRRNATKDKDGLEDFCQYIINKYDTTHCFAQYPEESPVEYRTRMRKKLEKWLSSAISGKPFVQNCQSMYQPIFEELKSVLESLRSRGEKVNVDIMQDHWIKCAVERGIDTKQVFHGFITKARNFCDKMNLDKGEYAKTKNTRIGKEENLNTRRKRKRESDVDDNNKENYMDVVFSQEEPLGKTSLISVGEPDGSETDTSSTEVPAIESDQRVPKKELHWLSEFQLTDKALDIKQLTDDQYQLVVRSRLSIEPEFEQQLREEQHAALHQIRAQRVELLKQQEHQKASVRQNGIEGIRAQCDMQLIAVNRDVADEFRLPTEAATVEQLRMPTEAATTDQLRLATEMAKVEQLRLATEMAKVEQLRLATEAAKVEQLRLAAEAAKVEQLRLEAVVASAKAIEQLEQLRLATEAAKVEQLRLAADVAKVEQLRLERDTTKADVDRLRVEVEGNRRVEEEQHCLESLRLEKVEVVAELDFLRLKRQEQIFELERIHLESETAKVLEEERRVNVQIASEQKLKDEQEKVDCLHSQLVNERLSLANQVQRIQHDGDVQRHEQEKRFEDEKHKQQLKMDKMLRTGERQLFELSNRFDKQKMNVVAEKVVNNSNSNSNISSYPVIDFDQLHNSGDMEPPSLGSSVNHEDLEDFIVNFDKQKMNVVAEKVVNNSNSNSNINSYPVIDFDQLHNSGDMEPPSLGSSVNHEDLEDFIKIVGKDCLVLTPAFIRSNTPLSEKETKRSKSKSLYVEHYLPFLRKYYEQLCKEIGFDVLVVFSPAVGDCGYWSGPIFDAVRKLHNSSVRIRSHSQIRTEVKSWLKLHWDRPLCNEQQVTTVLETYQAYLWDQPEKDMGGTKAEKLYRTTNIDKFRDPVYTGSPDQKDLKASLCAILLQDIDHWSKSPTFCNNVTMLALPDSLGADLGVYYFPAQKEMNEAEEEATDAEEDVGGGCSTRAKRSARRCKAKEIGKSQAADTEEGGPAAEEPDQYSNLFVQHYSCTDDGANHYNEKIYMAYMQPDHFLCCIPFVP